MASRFHPFGVVLARSFLPIIDYGFQKLCKGVHCVDLGESFQTHILLQNVASIQPRTSPVKFARRSAAALLLFSERGTSGRSRRSCCSAGTAPFRSRGGRRWLPAESPSRRPTWAASFDWLSKNSKICNFFHIFGGHVLGCIKTKFCKKICGWQHFSSSTRFAYFCTAAISKFYQKIGLKNQQFSWKFSIL